MRKLRAGFPAAASSVPVELLRFQGPASLQPGLHPAFPVPSDSSTRSGWGAERTPPSAAQQPCEALAPGNWAQKAGPWKWRQAPAILSARTTGSILAAHRTPWGAVMCPDAQATASPVHPGWWGGGVSASALPKVPG